MKSRHQVVLIWFTAIVVLLLLLLYSSAKAQVRILGSNGAPGLLVNGTVTVTNSPSAGCGSVEDPSHLVAWWTMDASSSGNLPDASGNNNSVPLNGSPSFPTSVITNGMSLNGSSQYGGGIANLSSQPSSITMTCWIKMGSGITGGEIISGSLSDWEFCIDVGTTGGGGHSGELSLYNSSVWTSCTTTINDGTWHFICASNDGTNTKFYVDGSIVNTVAQSGVGTAANAVSIGARGAGSTLLNGSLDDLRIYNAVESGTTISAIFSAGQPGQSGNGAGCPG